MPHSDGWRLEYFLGELPPQHIALLYEVSLHMRAHPEYASEAIDWVRNLLAPLELTWDEAQTLLARYSVLMSENDVEERSA